VHHDVIRFCNAELLEENYFHAVLEATKSLADKIRGLSGLTSDGGELVDAAFGLAGGLPRVAINSLTTDTEKSEHKGLMNIMKGIFGAFRNTTAHEAKIKWTVEEDDALDIPPCSRSFTGSWTRRSRCRAPVRSASNLVVREGAKSTRTG
jgi:uncharacterized protein (TIGR02391 family)